MSGDVFCLSHWGGSYWHLASVGGGFCWTAPQQRMVRLKMPVGPKSKETKGDWKGWDFSWTLEGEPGLDEQKGAERAGAGMGRNGL